MKVRNEDWVRIFFYIMTYPAIDILKVAINIIEDFIRTKAASSNAGRRIVASSLQLTVKENINNPLNQICDPQEVTVY